MQNQTPPDLPQPNLPPEGLILDPFHAPGLATLSPAPPLWRAIPAGHIHGFAPADPPLAAQVESLRAQLFTRAVQVATLPVVLADARFQRHRVTQGARCLVSGADPLLEAVPEPALIAHFDRLQAAPGPRQMQALAQDLAPGTPFAIDARAGLLPMLAHLCLLPQDLKGPIYLHGGPPEARAHVQALFPELAPRVIFAPQEAHYPEVVTPFTATTALYQLSGKDWDAFEQDFPPSGAWEGRRASAESRAILAANAVDASLFALRQRALDLAPPLAPQGLWIGPIDPELAELLSLFGFQALEETPDPLARIARIAAAPVILSAGHPDLALLFASPEAHVIALCPPDTLDAWPQTWSLAAVSGARALSFFVPDPLPRLALARIMALVAALLGQIPEFHQAEEVQILGQTLMTIGAQDRARAVFETHGALAEGHVGLSLTMADLASQGGDNAATLAALYSAYRADPSDWSVLIRMLWCARAMDQAELTGTILATLHDGFPDRYEAFSRARPWTRDFFSPDTPQGSP